MYTLTLDPHSQPVDRRVSSLAAQNGGVRVPLKGAEQAGQNTPLADACRPRAVCARGTLIVVIAVPPSYYALYDAWCERTPAPWPGGRARTRGAGGDYDPRCRSGVSMPVTRRRLRMPPLVWPGGKFVVASQPSRRGGGEGTIAVRPIVCGALFDSSFLPTRCLPQPATVQPYLPESEAGRHGPD